jgi:PAS domain S-box-containing protein/putative nucleotidyltransferase with HDIG domain
MIPNLTDPACALAGTLTRLKCTSLLAGSDRYIMKKPPTNTNGSCILKSLAERFLQARHGKLENIPRADVKRLVHELQVHQARLATQHQELHLAKKSNTEARDRYADLHDFVPVGYLTLDPQGTIAEINLTGVGMLRTEKSRLMNQHFHLWVAPEFREAWLTHFQRVFETGVRHSCEIKLLPQAGPPFYAALDSQVAPAGLSSACFCRTAMRDISAYKQAQSELQLKEQLLDGASDSIFLHDLEGHFVYVNDAACKDRGYEKDELLQRNVSLLATPEFAGKRGEFLKDLLAKGELIFEYAHLRKDGSALPVEIHARLIKLDGRQLILSVARDITKRLQAEKALQQQRELAQQFLDIAGVMMVALDQAGLITLMNKKGCELLGYQEEEIIGRNWFELCLSPTVAREFQAAFHRLKAGDLEGVEFCENPVLTKDGRERLIAFHNTVLRDQDAQITGILCSGEDVTDRRQAEAALRQSEQELTIRNRIAHIFLTIMDDAIYPAVLAVVLEALKSKCGLFGYTEENGALVVPAMTRHASDQGLAPQKDIVIPQEMWTDNLCAEAIRESQTLSPCGPATLTPPGYSTMERCLTVPLRCYDKAIGILMVADKDTDYDDQDIRRLEMIAATIAPILNDRLQKDRQEQSRQWAEEALRLAAHKWRTTFDAIKDAVCLLDPEGRILQCNQAMINLTGKSFDTILDHPCWEILHGAGQPREDCPFLRMKQTRQREESIMALQNHWLKETVDPILDEAGTLIGGVHLTSDITSAKKAEAEMRESEARFRAIFDQAAVGVALVETATVRFLKVNQKLCDIVGLTPDEMISTTYKDFTHPDDLQAGTEEIQKLRDGLIQSFTLEKRYIHKDGSFVWVNLAVSAMQQFGARSPYHIVVVQDITQRRQAEMEVRQGLDKLHQALSGTVGALANTVETKDPYTAGHQRRVAQLACAIARELGWPPDLVEGMHVLSFLHDIGKIAVPAEILSRPGKISNIEFNLIRAHPEVGYNILKDIEFPWPVAQAVLQHHERLDGSGYPAGLADAEIIREARILAVADVVEAMASHRPYRPSLGIAAALEEIGKHKGTLFDAKAVEACLQLFREKDFAFL